MQCRVIARVLIVVEMHGRVIGMPPTRLTRARPLMTRGEVISPAVTARWRPGLDGAASCGGEHFRRAVTMRRALRALFGSLCRGV